MLKKELKEVLNQTIILIVSVFLLLYPIYLIASIFTKHTFVFSEYFQMFYQLFILFFSFFLGISMFSREIRNNGFEYLLTLPFSRTKLLLLKIVPRFVSLVILYLGYLLLLALSSTDPFIITPVAFIALYFSLFFISTSLSVLRGNFVGNSIITFLLFLLLLFATNFVAWLVIIKHYGRIESFKLGAFAASDNYPFSSFSIVLLAFLVSVPFLVSLFHGFKKYDVRVPKRYLKRFITLLIPLVIIGMSLAFLFLNNNISDRYEYYYLTKDGMVIRSTLVKTFVFSNGMEKEITNLNPIWWATYERGNSIYLSHVDRAHGFKGEISELNKKTLKLKELYVPGESRYLLRRVYGYGDTICFMERTGTRSSGGNGKSEIIFMDLKSREVKRAAFPYQQFQLCGVVQSGVERFWIGFFISDGKTNVFQIDEWGQLKQLTRSDWYPVYFNDMLITFENGNIIAGKISDSGYKELKRFPVQKYYFYPHRLYWTDLNPVKVDYIYGKKSDKNLIEGFVMIDLVNLEIKEFNIDFVKYGQILFNLFGDSLFTKYEDEGYSVLDAIYRFDGEKLALLRDFPRIKYSDRIDFYSTKYGFVIKEGKKVRFFLYPDLKELKY